MSVLLQSTPISNTLPYRVSLLRGGAGFATLEHGDANVLTGRFDGLLVAAGVPAVGYVQETPGNLEVPVGDVAFFEGRPNQRIALCHAPPHGVQHSVIFRRA